jgi:DNA-binding CsgD family transcriptional regulator
MEVGVLAMAEATLAVTRRVESPVVSNFLACAFEQPSGLVVEGEAGIGKTTFLLSIQELAQERGFQVLSARSAATETVLAYASLADLLSGVDPARWSKLPEPQRLAIDRVMLRASAEGVVTDQRAVAAGFVSVVQDLATEKPVLLAIDDLQWLDPSSAAVVGFAGRRLSGPVGVLVTVRIEPDSDAAGWLRLPRPDAVQRVRLPPMGLGELHHAMSERLGRSFPRPTLVRIHEISGGNPFYAIELGRAIATETIRADTPLPGTLAELVRTRLGALGADVQDVLLAAACDAAPTVELLSHALDAEPDEIVGLLDQASDKGIVVLDGYQVRFAHPLLARGVYTGASPSRRREMHRRMATAVDESEVRARHLAFAAVKGDAATLESLDAAAETVRVRGAPAAAAELLDLAIGLGGDTPERRIRSASYHFDAGDPDRASTLLEETMDRLPRGGIRAGAATLLASVRLLNDNFIEAAGLLERYLDEAAGNLALMVQMLVMLAFALVNGGKADDAVLRVEEAVREAERLAQPRQLSQALSMRAMLHFMRGDGLDKQNLQRALDLEDHTANVSVAFQPSVQNALLLAWTGELDGARHDMASIRRRCIAQGDDGELIFVAFHSVLIEVWRGDFKTAAEIADETMELAEQLNGDLALFIAFTLRGGVAAYDGREQDARSDIKDALAAAQRASSHRLVEWPITILGFLEVSLGNYNAAVDTLKPLLATLETRPESTEIIAASYVPEAVEALIQLDRFAEAEPLIEALERNGRRLDRPWMLAVSARGRGMLLAARGDLHGASDAVQRAMVEHARLPMPFERARTQLLLGQIQRRQRQKDVAASTLAEALAAFEGLGTPLWANRTRAELQRVKVGRQQSMVLSASEQRVAELAASGMTNREIASALFISPKTVESNIARIYRKLGIHGRAELGRHFGHGQ